MPRFLLLALALLAACADALDDSAAVIQAEIDSLQALVEQDLQRVEDGFRDLDSLRAEVDGTAADVEATRARADALDAELNGE